MKKESGIRGQREIEVEKKAVIQDECAVSNKTVGCSVESAAAAARANSVAASALDRAEQVEENTDLSQTDPDDAPNAQAEHDAPAKDDNSPDVQE